MNSLMSALALSALSPRISATQQLPSSQNFHHSSKCSLQTSSSLISVPHSHTNSSLDALSAIQESGIIACLRADSAELAFQAACAALDGGVTALEIVMSNPGVFEVLEKLIEFYPTRTFGVGTVLNPVDANTAIKFGAKFLMSPAMVKGILDYASCCEVLYIPGAMTPTEILSAFDAGAKLIKVYPVSSIGGVQYIGALRKPFPHIPLVASQGITLDSVFEYIAQGSAAVVLSDAIFDKKAMAERNFEAIYQFSRSAVLFANRALKRKQRNMR
ncbi:OLC1v1001356C1 [Oldenlandia corymbosa var. corymbosa]|uniref:OLC1v1001356C1 n=1 Tax=Oldenlandia corymbosa var. corymbosa TaxID=529605 RepID=A0AAV1D7M0_OLDCO|nr:OLC1v1001356C1 [Oldenlandia corymbosa var. corymbosa]